MTQLTQKSVKFAWFEKYEQSFQELKDRLVFAPVLAILEELDGLAIYSDASKLGLSHILIQCGNVTAYVS